MSAEDRDWYFEKQTIAAATALIRTLMERYGIPAERVIRHHDVTGKVCPAPFVHSEAAWNEFKQNLEVEEEMRYNHIDELPSWAKEAVSRYIDAGALNGTGSGLDLSEDMLRIIVIIDRYIKAAR